MVLSLRDQSSPSVHYQKHSSQAAAAGCKMGWKARASGDRASPRRPGRATCTWCAADWISQNSLTEAVCPLMSEATCKP